MFIFPTYCNLFLCVLPQLWDVKTPTLSLNTRSRVVCHRVRHAEIFEISRIFTYLVILIRFHFLLDPTAGLLLLLSYCQLGIEGNE